MRLKPLQIAIDGPIGSGKSTAAAGVAKRLGIFLVDAGALYRAAALIVIRHKIRPDKAAEAAVLFRRAKIIERKPTEQEADCRKITVLLDGEDISWAIRTHEIDDLVAKFAVYKEIIEAVHQKEREMSWSQDVVTEGREIGTMVLPNAQVKVYLTADVHERAKRRFWEYEAKGDKTPHSEIVRALKERDELDMKRVYAPLRKAEDAVLIDTTDKTVNEVADEIIRLVPGEYLVKTNKLTNDKLTNKPLINIKTNKPEKHL